MSDNQKLFDSTCEEFADYAQGLFDRIYKENAKIDDDDKFEMLTDPVLAAFMCVITDIAQQAGYSRGDLIDRICDFYQASEESMAEMDDEDFDADVSDKKNIN